MPCLFAHEDLSTITLARLEYVFFDIRANVRMRSILSHYTYLLVGDFLCQA